MIASKESVIVSLIQACKDGLIGIGRGASLSKLQSRYCKHDVTIDPSEEGLWIIPSFESQTETGAKESSAEDWQPVLSAVQRQVNGAGTSGLIETPERSVRRIVIRGSVPIENWGDLFRSFIAPSTRLNLKRHRLGIDIELEFHDGIRMTVADGTVKAMKEAARQLGLAFEIQEEGPSISGADSSNR